MWVLFLGWKKPWRRAWQPTPIFLSGEIPWTEEPGRLQSLGSQRVKHDWATKHNTAHKWVQRAKRKAPLSLIVKYEWKMNETVILVWALNPISWKNALISVNSSFPNLIFCLSLILVPSWSSTIYIFIFSQLLYMLAWSFISFGATVLFLP